MPSSYRNRLFREIEKEELPDCPKGWTVKTYIKAIGKEADSQIRLFVEDLLSLGYPTFSSCAGGPGHITKEGGVGFVMIEQSLSTEEKKEIKSLAREHNLKIIRVRNVGQDQSEILFNPVGGLPKNR